MPPYVPIEYPKWVNGQIAQNAAEESAILAARAEAAAAALAEKRARPPSPAAVRMRRTRTRRREGKLVIRWDISTAQIEILAAAGFLDRAKRDDAAEVARGVGRLMDQVAKFPSQHARAVHPEAREAEEAGRLWLSPLVPSY